MLKGPTFGNLGEIQQIAILKRGKHIDEVHSVGRQINDERIMRIMGHPQLGEIKANFF